jgi:hypothetical protein
VQVKADTAIQCELDSQVVTIMVPLTAVVNEGDFIAMCIVKVQGLDMGMSYRNLTKNTEFIMPTKGLFAMGMLSWEHYPLLTTSGQQISAGA